MYFESYDDLVLNKDSVPDNAIIYEADKKWTPTRLNQHHVLKECTDCNKLVGRRAELKFEKLALENGFVTQRIDQCQKSYFNYRKVVGDTKRSDFLIMNLGHVEIDVKCQTLKNIHGKEFYLLNKSDIERHKVILKQTYRQLIFAIFRRYKNWQVNKSLGMIKLEDVELCDLARINHDYFYLVPVNKLKPKFQLLHEIKQSVLPKANTSHTINTPHTTRDKKNNIIQLMRPRFLLYILVAATLTLVAIKMV